MSDAIVRYELANSVATITMDDGKANALSPAMLDQVNAALDRVTADSAGAVVLAGRADKFCAGFDLKIMMSGPENATALLRQGADFLLRLYALPVPLVVAVSGHAMAGGALVVLTGDTRYVADGPYKIGLNEVAIGLPVPMLAMELARDRLSKRELTRATLLAQIYSPSEAHAAGYVDKVVPAAELLATATAEAERLAKLPKHAFVGTKQRLRDATVNLIRSSFEDDVRKALGR